MLQAGAPLVNQQQALEMLHRLDKTAPSARHALEEFVELLSLEKKYLDLAVKEVYESALPETGVFPLDQAKEVLEDLCRAHYLALVTVGNQELQLAKMKKAGIDSALFSKIVVTEKKDKKEHYKAIVEGLGISAADVFVCGDRVPIDLSPAKALGFTTIHMRSGRGMMRMGEGQDVDYAIAHLSEIKEILLKSRENDN